MPYSSSCFFLQIFLCLCLNLPAQRARYTEEYKGVYHIKIAGYLKNNLHAWSADVSSSRFRNGTTTLSLHIFSPDMRLLHKSTVPLGKITLWDIDFQQEENFYYAKIVYISERQRTMLLRVDPSGNITDVTASPGLWQKLNLPMNGNSIFNMRVISNRSFATVKKNNNLFVALTQSTAASDSLETGEFLRLPQETGDDGEVLEKLIVRKINLATKEWIYQVFGSKISRFYHPLLHVTDSSILVAATTEQKRTLAGKEPLYGPLLFIARLDTSLTDSSTRVSLLKSKNGKKDETYSPFELFPIQDKIAVFSSGLYQRETYYFAPGSPASGMPPVPRVTRSYFINSLKITLLDENNHLLKDTIIEKKFGTMQWDNFFSTSSAKSIDLFCMRKYRGNKNGITRFSINGDGAIYEEDMIVDIKNEYNLSGAKETSPGVLVIPFTRKGRAGLVRMEFQPVD